MENFFTYFKVVCVSQVFEIILTIHILYMCKERLPIILSIHERPLKSYSLSYS